ncbi:MULTISPECIES: hypothetical protein [unclassified Devosia]|nr:MULTISPECIES: hypothetical protein [unclassified Devosia]MBN9305590.1 hypothetical protein [Devosia sp.]
MPRIAEFIDPTPDPVWRPAQQCGVTAAFGRPFAIGCIRVHTEAGR